jgi:hypothetical protein
MNQLDKSIKQQRKKHWIKGIRIRETDEVEFFFDDKHSQLIIQSPPWMGHIFYVPYSKIKRLTK